VKVLFTEGNEALRDVVDVDEFYWIVDKGFLWEKGERGFG
jgi:hypothetical protein